MEEWGMRFLLSRTDALGDLMVSLPLVSRLLSRDPEAEIHLLVRPYCAGVLEGLPGLAGIHLRGEDSELEPLMRRLAPDAVLNLYHRDRAVTLASKRAGVPIRVARARGLDQILAATHRLWRGRNGTGRHEAQNVLDFLAPWGWAGGWPEPPRLMLRDDERARARTELGGTLQPRLGIVRRGSGSGAFPSDSWWDHAIPVWEGAGWHPVTLGPAEASLLPGTDLRGLMARIAACDALISPSTGPAHLAAALEVPLLCLMGRRSNHSPDRWAPLGNRVQILQYPGPEADLTGGMDRLDPATLLPHLDRLR